MKITSFRSSSSGERLKKLPEGLLRREYPLQNQLIFVDPSQKFQRIIGFGGALTESSAYLLSKMDAAKRSYVLKSYFSPLGAGYNLVRVCLNSSDFSLGNYDYLAGEDKTLKSFSLAHEDQYVLPALKEARSYAREQRLTLLGSPWSPCAFMKSNHEMNHGGSLLPEYYGLWAEYEALYCDEMAKRGFPLRYLTIQNEPEATQTWDSCRYSPEEEAAYLPVLRKALDQHGHPDIGLFVWDHNRDTMIPRLERTFANPEVRGMAEGIAYHWYDQIGAKNVGLAHALFPDKPLLFTEGCVELLRPEEQGVKMGSWSHGEHYGREYSDCLNNFSAGFIDWNLVLNRQGGPNHVGNYCEAPVIYDEGQDLLTFNSSFYFITHFARAFLPGSVRLAAQNSFLPNEVYVAACERPDGSLAVVVQNHTGEGKTATLRVGLEGAEVLLPAHSITTYFLF
jgi:glucosylceramidase